MKSRYFLAALWIALVAVNGHPSSRAKEERLHPGLERLKSLEGHWVGWAVWDEGGYASCPSWW